MLQETKSQTSKKKKNNQSFKHSEGCFFDTQNYALNSEKIKGENKMKNELLIPMNLQFFAEEGDASVTESEVAEPTEVAEETTTEEISSTEESTDSNVQSAEENAKYAAARRRAEAEFAERQRREDEKFARMFKDYENPITHEPIRNAQDYLNALDAQNKLRTQEELESKGIDPKLFEDMVNRQVENNPYVQQAQVVLQQARQRELDSAIAEGLKEISMLNPNIKTLDDVMALPNAKQIVDYTQTLSLAEAYKLANFDSLMAGKTASAKQAVLNNMNGTSHLNQTDGIADSNDNEVEIPQNELAQWQRAFPHASMAELRKKYNRQLNS